MTSRSSSDSPEIQEARLYHQTGRLAEAQAMYREILGKRPNDSAALYGLGVILVDLGKVRLAERYFEEALSHGTGEVQYYRSYASLVLKRGDTERAMNILRTCLTLYPDDVETLVLLADYSLRQDDVFAAIDLYRRVVALSPGAAKAQHSLASSLFQCGFVADALPHFTAAHELLPYSLDVTLEYADALLAVGKVDVCAALLEEARLLYPKVPELHQRRGRVALRRGLVDTALEALETAFFLNNRLENLLRDYAAALDAAGDHKGAAKALAAGGA
ncbi:MAG: tetratricopeptide repeat protein [Holosporales bacterium]